MATALCERAISDAIKHGNALLKFISPNDAGITGSHQCGFYLPISAWRMYSPQEPKDGVNHKHDVRIVWQHGRETRSVVTWYGKRTRHEYRLTRFGSRFPFLGADSVGNLLVLIPRSLTDFIAYVLDLEDDINDLQTALGVEVVNTWGVFRQGAAEIETEEDCVQGHFRDFAASVQSFPSCATFSAKTREALVDCIGGFLEEPVDDRLVRSVAAEYRLFRLVERRLCEPHICRVFQSIEEFLGTAGTIMNRRKSRAGRAFENHVEFILQDIGVPHEMQPDIDGKPDIVIPSKQAYDDPRYPTDKLFVVGLKTTCKDRWRQVLEEGRRVRKKYLLTLQRGISRGQLSKIKRAGVSLVVPRSLHNNYPPNSPMRLQTLDGFIRHVQRRLAQ